MKKLALVSILMLVLIPTILAGCTPSGGGGTVPTNLREFSFTDMWNKVVNATGVNDETAHLFDFTLHIGKNGSVDALYFNFCTDDGIGKLYNVNIDTTGGIRTQTYTGGVDALSQKTMSPRYFFDALDKADLSEMFDANTTTYILARSYSGDIGYGSNEYADLCLLDEGRLTPLKEVIFHSNIPWVPIEIYNMTDTVAGASIGETWFLPQDLVKATVIVYLNQSFDIYLVDTGELVISDQDIASYNASTHEITLNDDGIKRWNSYIPYNDSFNPPIPKLGGLYQREFSVKVNGEEIYRGKFWSAASSQSYDDIVILDVLSSLDDENNTIRIDNGYPVSNSSSGPTNDPRIIDFFDKTGLLE